MSAKNTSVELTCNYLADHKNGASRYLKRDDVNPKYYIYLP